MRGDASRALVSSLSRQMEVAGLDKGPEMDRDSRRNPSRVPGTFIIIY